MPKRTPTPNDQRANVKNPNNPARKADLDNRSRQIAEHKYGRTTN